jgi:predicted ATPase
VRNFKAVADSEPLKLTPLTVFIGNNGSGKSSIIEALQTLQRLVTLGLDGAMQAFKGIEHLRNKSAPLKPQRRKVLDPRPEFKPLECRLAGSIQPSGGSRSPSVKFSSLTQIGDRDNLNRYVLERDDATILGRGPFRSTDVGAPIAESQPVNLIQVAGSFIRRWQFLTLDPARMGQPSPTRRAVDAFLLEPDGSNVTDYLWHMVKDYGELGTAAWNGIVEALRFVLPYAGDVRPTMTEEVERRSLLTMQERYGPSGESKFDVPGWMLSTGTMRALAMLAVFRHPDPPPLICIEEIENGLDPRTLNMIVDELKRIVVARQSQIILTTHSPYLLDLLPLQSIVVTERENGGVRFWRPDGQKSLKLWAERFRPGQLYTMGRLTRHGTAKGD